MPFEGRGLFRVTACADVPWSRRGGHLIVVVRLTPKSARDEIVGLGRLSDERPVLQVRVRALPQDGKANQALIKVLAKALRVPTTSVDLESGTTGRVKTLRLGGDADVLQSALARLSGLGEPGPARKR